MPRRRLLPLLSTGFAVGTEEPRAREVATGSVPAAGWGGVTVPVLALRVVELELELEMGLALAPVRLGSEAEAEAGAESDRAGAAGVDARGRPRARPPLEEVAVAVAVGAVVGAAVEAATVDAGVGARLPASAAFSWPRGCCGCDTLRRRPSCRVESSGTVRALPLSRPHRDAEVTAVDVRLRNRVPRPAWQAADEEGAEAEAEAVAVPEEAAGREPPRDPVTLPV